MFERDIRAWAKDKCGMKFDSSGMCAHTLTILLRLLTVA